MEVGERESVSPTCLPSSCHLPLPVTWGLRINPGIREGNGVISLEQGRKIRKRIYENALNTSHVSPCCNLFRM
jgi:hypothetical protein